MTSCNGENTHVVTAISVLQLCLLYSIINKSLVSSVVLWAIILVRQHGEVLLGFPFSNRTNVAGRKSLMKAVGSIPGEHTGTLLGQHGVRFRIWDFSAWEAALRPQPNQPTQQLNWVPAFIFLLSVSVC